MMTVNKLPEFLENLKAMTNKSVFVGIPHDSTRKDSEPYSNAQIGMVMEFGSAIKNIPPRPFLIPALKESQKEAIAILKEGAQQALHGEDIEISFNKAGLFSQNKVKAKIVNGSFEALKQSTLAARMRRRKSGVAGTKPLIDTGQLLASITYVVRENA